MKISVVLGTRPEIIKMSPVIRELDKRNIDFFILHTGQHYSYRLDKVFFEQLSLPQPQYNLDVGSGSHAEETARMLLGIEGVLSRELPDFVLVEGDTNSVMAGALAAVKLHIKVGHVEAGLRSNDRNMPEEINRILTDHIAEHLYAPTPKAEEILRNEGIPRDRIFVTGNTIVDAVYQNVELAIRNKDTLKTFNIKEKEYFLLTLHRQENVDDRGRLSSILEGLAKAAEQFQLPILYPVHPRSKKRMDEFKLTPQGLLQIEPVDFLTFLNLEKNAKLVITDSGGVQEEACILGVPCVTVRDNTERPETVEVGANIVAGTSSHTIVESVRTMMGREGQWGNPFGDGRAAERIVQALTEA